MALEDCLSKNELVIKTRREVDEKYKELIRAKNMEIRKLIVSYELRVCAMCVHLNKGCTLRVSVKNSGCGLFEGTKEYSKKVQESL